MDNSDSKGEWTLREVKAHLAQILLLSEVAGPQFINARQTDDPHIKEQKTFVVVPAELWREKNPPKKPLGQWLVENTPRGTNLEIPRDRSSRRQIPFVGEDTD